MTIYIALIRGINVGGHKLIKMGEYRIIGQEIYLLYRESVRDSKLANHLPKLDIPMTMRNWNTMNKLVALAEEMER